MTVVSLPVPRLQVRSTIPAWEWVLVHAALLLSTTAVVPMIFNPSAEPGAAVVDPVSQPAWALIGIAVLYAALRVRGEIAYAVLRNPAIVALCYLALVSTFWSVLPARTFELGVELAFSTVLGFYVGTRFGIRRLVRILSWITAGVLALSIVLALALPEYGIDPIRDQAWRGAFSTKNELGRICIFGAVVWAVRGIAGEISGARAALFVGAFAAVATLSAARTALGVGLLMLGVGVLAWLFSREGSAWRPIKGAVVATLAVVGLTCLLRIELLLAVIGSDLELTGRQGIWEAVWDAISDRPLVGYGYQAFWQGFEGPSLAVLRHAGHFTPHSHNALLDLTLSLGVVGLLAFLVAWGTALRRSLWSLRHSTGTSRTFPFIVLSLMLLYNMTESALIGRSLQWVLLVAVAAALALETRQSRE